ncbi:MAG: pyridoxal-dependent decarboxylase [Myxococcota bacterium]
MTDAARELRDFEGTAIDTVSALSAHVGRMSDGEGPASGFAPLREIYDALEIERWLDGGGMTRESFRSFLASYLEHSAMLHHPRYLAHQVGAPDLAGGLAGLLNGVTNNPMGIYEMGPSAATLEFAVVNWMLKKVGWAPQPFPGASPPSTGAKLGHAGGVLTHGGSLGNLTALLAARARAAPDAWQDGTPPDLAVMVPAVSHYSCARAVSMIGVGARGIYAIPTTRFGIIEPSSLEGVLRQVRADGRRPMALIANACSTATGLYDPLRPIGEFCRAHDIWFHADACHGASSLLAPRARKYLDGLELADSIVWDTHKMMQVPALCAAVLLREAGDFARAFQQDASYLAWDDDGESYSAMRRAVECTKAGLGVKVFLTLAFQGERALGEFIDDRSEEVARFAQIIAARPGFEVPYAPESNILCFRYGDDDDLQQHIRDRLLRTGEFHLSSAVVDGRRHLRITSMGKYTRDEDIHAMLSAIEREAAS